MVTVGEESTSILDVDVIATSSNHAESPCLPVADDNTPPDPDVMVNPANTDKDTPPRDNSSESDLSPTQERKRPLRSIKRRKFDDELVESSLIKCRAGTGGGRASYFDGFGYGSTSQFVPAPISLNKKRLSGKKKPKTSSVTLSDRSAGVWLPTDDLTLIINVQQTCDLSTVYLHSPFSRSFTLEEISERWYALLYDPVLSKSAVENIKSLDSSLKARVCGSALYSKQEEHILKSVASMSHPSLDTFESLLCQYVSVFNPYRTPQTLMQHWNSMKSFQLLHDQAPKANPSFPQKAQDDVLFDNNEMMSSFHGDDVVKAERPGGKEIKMESSLDSRVLTVPVVGISPTQFDSQTFAILKGHLVQYLIRSREVTFGRNAKGYTLDIDLSVEGPVHKVSRKQGIIKINATGEFLLLNVAPHSVSVDGQPVLCMQTVCLRNESVVEVSCLKFVFLINPQFAARRQMESLDSKCG